MMRRKAHMKQRDKFLNYQIFTFQNKALAYIRLLAMKVYNCAREKSKEDGVVAEYRSSMDSVQNTIPENVTMNSCQKGSTTDKSVNTTQTIESVDPNAIPACTS